MKIALIHDYLNEFGGAERVLLALSEIWPKAPIFTSYYKTGSPAWERFKNKKIVVSWAHHIPFWDKLASPLRFLAPLIWGSIVHQLTDYDIVISSSSWYVTKGFGSQKSEVRSQKGPIEICYCHTPPRYLYGYQTSVDWQKYWPVRIYATIINHLMRLYDFKQAQKVNYFIANSKNVAERIKKFYRREATVIYPPVEIMAGPATSFPPASARRASWRAARVSGAPPLVSPVIKRRGDYYLVVSRIVGGKGLEMAIRAANKLGFTLKVVGEPGGYGREYQKLRNISKSNIEYLGFVEDSELVELYKGAKGFLAVAQDEDFGITPVEAMMAGTPVVAYRGGGYVESVRPGRTGLFFNDYSVDALIDTLKQFDKMKFDRIAIAKYAQKFNKERFKKEIREFVNNHINK